MIATRPAAVLRSTGCGYPVEICGLAFTVVGHRMQEPVLAQKPRLAVRAPQRRLRSITTSSSTGCTPRILRPHGAPGSSRLTAPAVAPVDELDRGRRPPHPSSSAVTTSAPVDRLSVARAHLGPPVTRPSAMVTVKGFGDLGARPPSRAHACARRKRQAFGRRIRIRSASRGGAGTWPPRGFRSSSGLVPGRSDRGRDRTFTLCVQARGLYSRSACGSQPWTRSTRCASLG